MHIYSCTKIHTLSGKTLSKWMPGISPKRAKNEDPNESRAVFVDEFTCIGCKQCVWQAPATFRIEPEHGRSRVFAQWWVALHRLALARYKGKDRALDCL
jgi:NAD-dependent dihydropyrimidine dehydrogenase PreA subunit